MLSADNFRTLLDGAQLTVYVTALAVAWGTVVAVVLGVASLSAPTPVRWAVRVYVEVLRGVSAIILIFWVYYALPLLGVEFSAMQAAVLALGLNLSAYGAEIVRGAVQAVPRGQSEAAVAINLSSGQRLWSIVLPQAVVGMLPPYGNLLIEVMKASSLVSLISLADLTREAQNLRQLRAADSVSIFTAVLIIYFAISLGITGIIRLLERRFGRGLETGRMGSRAATAK
ncbi:MAG: ectoine/hydroxyectoine ABC transporter permease subunit EhuC [Acidimicrobiia bacterium]|nr:ectoine/hydroxyectoine ABC transporter permease subunit EhuC [Acidimicrobiia bacterium]